MNDVSRAPDFAAALGGDPPWQRRRSLRLVYWSAAAGWFSGLALIGLLWRQHRAGILHPGAIPFIFLLSLSISGGLAGGASGLGRAVRGSRRRDAAAWGLACLMPFCFWLGLATYTLRVASTGSAFPKNFFSDIALTAVASLLEGHAHLAYPHRLESQRLVMFYDDRVTDPHKDLEAMDRHVAALETLTGRPLRAKIHWVRGELLGRRQFAIRGLALGSSRSPANWETADHPFNLSVDRHELAHGVMHQLQPVDADAPTLLIEGWAEANSGLVPHKQAEFALHSRSLWREQGGASPSPSYLGELTGVDWYRRVDGAVYSVGAPLAAFILKNYGVDRFLQLYFACRPGKFAEACASELGVELAALESAFWADVERLATDAAGVR